MKKIINKILIIVLLISSVSSCEDIDNPIYDVFDDLSHGAVLRTLERVSTNFNLFDPTSKWEIIVEAQDEESGRLLSKVDVYVSFSENQDDDGANGSKPEILMTSFNASEFTTSANGLPSTSISATLSETANALGLVDGEYTGGDTFNYRLEYVMTDGRSFSSDDASGSLQGSYFQSPYLYQAGLLCIPDAPFPGDYVIDMFDSYGDGWQGSSVTVTIDGVDTVATIPDYWSTGEGPYTEFTQTVNVPDGTQTLVFTWASGDYPSECSYEIYAPSGTLAAADGPSPSTGEIALMLCKE